MESGPVLNFQLGGRRDNVSVDDFTCYSSCHGDIHLIKKVHLASGQQDLGGGEQGERLGVLVALKEARHRLLMSASSCEGGREDQRTVGGSGLELCH